MSWQTINRILGLAMIDEVFADLLLRDPHEALASYGIQLSVEEWKILDRCQARNLQELSEQLSEKLGPGTSS